MVATPIGNLGDLSARVAETLRRVDLVAAEDTRETRKLVAHVGAETRLVSIHAHSDRARLDGVIAALIAGQDVAYCSDAGTPGVSDPGPVLVSLARAQGIPVIPIPGPSAVATALAATGWPADRYVFEGFPPRKGRDREEWLVRVKESAVPVVCFEAANRTPSLVADLALVVGAGRRILLGREMTKRFEEYRVAEIHQLAIELADAELRGEVTLVIEGAPGAKEPVVDRGAAATLASALKRAGVEPSRVAKILAEIYQLSRNESYRLAMEESA